MGHGLRDGVTVYRLPVGSQFLVVSSGDLAGGAVAERLGPGAVLVAVRDEGYAQVYMDNEAASAGVVPATLAEGAHRLVWRAGMPEGRCDSHDPAPDGLSNCCELAAGHAGLHAGRGQWWSGQPSGGGR